MEGAAPPVLRQRARKSSPHAARAWVLLLLAALGIYAWRKYTAARTTPAATAPDTERLSRRPAAPRVGDLSPAKTLAYRRQSVPARARARTGHVGRMSSLVAIAWLVLLAAVPAAGAHQESFSASIPQTLWAIDVTPSLAAHMTAATVVNWHARGINSVVLETNVLGKAATANAAAFAVYGNLAVIAIDGADGTCHVLVVRSPCTTTASSASQALQLARTRSPSTVIAIRLSSPGALSSLRSVRGTGARILAIPTLSMHPSFPKRAWEQAITLTATTPSLSLAVRPSSASAGLAEYLPLLSSASSAPASVIPSSAPASKTPSATGTPAVAAPGTTTTPAGGGGAASGAATPIADTTPLSKPPHLITTSQTQTSVTLSWADSTDNVAVTSYDLYDGTALVGSTAATDYVIGGLSCGTAYTINLAARDEAGDVSGQATLLVSTSACGNVTAANLWVSPTGNDSTGTRSATLIPDPGTDFATLGGACAKAQGGDNVAIEPGSYPAAQLVTYADCPDAAPAVVFACATSAVALTATGSMPCQFPAGVFLCGNLTCNSTSDPGASYVTISGVESDTIQTQGAAFKASPIQTHTNIINDWLTDWGQVNYALIVGPANDSLVEGNQLGPSCCQDWGMTFGVNCVNSSCTSQLAAENVTIEGNYLHDNVGTCNPTEYAGMIRAKNVAACQAGGAAGSTDMYGAGDGDVGLTTTLVGNLTSSSTTMTVSAGFSWMPSSTGFLIQIGTEVMQVVTTPGSATTWHIVHAGSCTGPNGGFCTSPAPHTSGATVSFFDAGYHHIDGIIMESCSSCQITGNTFYNTALNGDIFGTGCAVASSCALDGNGLVYDNVTIADNYFGDSCNGQCGTAVSLSSNSAPGSGGDGLIGGTIVYAYNTDQNALTLGGSKDFAAGATVDIVGNIGSWTPKVDPFVSGGCRLQRGDGTLFTPTYSHNAFTNAPGCGGSEIDTAPAFVNASTQTPDLDLVLNGWAGVGGGESVYCGPGKLDSVDIYGTARPSTSCTVGASQTG